LNPAEALPKAKEVPTPADIKIPTGKTKPDKTPPKQASNVTPPNETTTPSNAVPGQGGQAALPFGGTATGSGQASFGDGTFGSRFPEYVTNMTRALRDAWENSIGVQRSSLPRVYVTFTINRGNGRRGEVSNLEIDKSSGSPQVDNSARRAVTIATVPDLPREYSGSNVEVRFYFEYTR
jgi:TonB family protein